MYVLLALSSAVLYGIWEFGIGRYRGRVKVYGIILVSAIATTITYLLNGVFRHDLMLDKNDVVPRLLGGTFNLIATILALKAFARGKMGVVTGVAAASILVPLGTAWLFILDGRGTFTVIFYRHRGYGRRAYRLLRVQYEG